MVVTQAQRLRSSVRSDLALLLALALVKLVAHTLTNTQYGFHRDELATLDDARSLAWGYVAYPPLTPWVARLALDLFGPSLPGLRFFAALTQSAAMVLAGLLAREMGGGRAAQVVTALAVAIAPVSFAVSTLFQYVAFDYLWWTLIAYLVARLLNSDNPRWWLGIGAVIGVGMMTKYTIAFYVIGIIVGVLLTPARRYLTSRWLWAGAGLSLLIFLPNLVWQAQHSFISLEFLSSIHARDVRIGRTSEFWLDQVRLASNPFTLPLWLAGLAFLFVSPRGHRYRMLGWMAVVPVALFALAQGRGYYTGPVYPILLAAGAVWGEGWLARLTPGRARLVRGVTAALLIVGGVIVVLLGPYAPLNSPLWTIVNSINGEWREEVGWPDLVQTVAGIYHALPAEDKGQAGILAGNYGEAGALNLYGPQYGLPTAISGVNSYWLRGYGDPPPQTLVVVGFSLGYAFRFFETCEIAGRNTNAYGIRNEESVDHPDILVCRTPRRPWPALWPDLRSFG